MKITTWHNRKAHLVLTYDHGEPVAYCGRIFSQYRFPNSRQKVCKICTKEKRIWDKLEKEADKQTKGKNTKFLPD